MQCCNVYWDYLIHFEPSKINLPFLTLFGSGVGGELDSAPMTFSIIAPRKTTKFGGMEYQNLSYCIRKTPRQVSGSKKIIMPGPEAVEVSPAENLVKNHLGMFLPIICKKKFGGLVQK